MLDPIEHLNAALDGRYRVERELGEGGMATVYLAHDLKHARRVALKVLKPELAAVVGADRFLAEIRTTASLQHPHILPLFDSGEADGLLFYVMPCVEGESLADRMGRTHQLPVDEAIRIATAVAQALDYAHRHGVIHRDIKPSNILMHEGEPVISDFGIALAVKAGGGSRLTETGLSLGTPQYMSPEQAMGEPTVGAATDIYALGCVLYEMLVGEPPFKGSTAQAILAKVIMGERVSATAQRRLVPPHVDGVIRRALEQLPADRFTSARDMAAALGDPDYRYGEPAAASAPGHWRQLALGLAASTVLLAAVSAWSLRPKDSAPERRVVRSLLTPPEGQRLVPALGVDVSLSPDGSWLVYVGEGPGGETQLWKREMKALDAVPIPGTVGARAPVVAPDGMSIAFAAEGEVRTLALAGGPPVTVAAPGATPAWGMDGMIYFARDGIVYRVGASGGEPVPFTAPIENVVQQHVDVLPDGAGVLFTAFVGTSAQARIFAVGAAGGAGREVGVETGVGATRWRGGAGGSGVARRVRLAGALAGRQARGRCHSGPALHGRVGEAARSRTKRADRGGDPVLELDQPWAVAEALWSPDGTWLLHRTSSNVRGAGDILGQRRGGKAPPVPLLTSPFTEIAPAISPNGRWLAYVSNETGRPEIFVVPFPNTGDARWPVSVAGGTEPLWSRDGRELFYRNGQGALVSVRLAEGRDFAMGATTVLFGALRYQRNFVHRQYDVTADGQRFLFLRPVRANREGELVLVQHFAEEIERSSRQ